MSGYDRWKTDDQHQPLFEPNGRRLTADDFAADDGPSVCDIPGCDEPVRCTLASIGGFCSEAHRQLGANLHEQAMTRRRAG